MNQKKTNRENTFKKVDYSSSDSDISEDVKKPLRFTELVALLVLDSRRKKKEEVQHNATRQTNKLTVGKPPITLKKERKRKETNSKEKERPILSGRPILPPLSQKSQTQGDMKSYKIEILSKMRQLDEAEERYLQLGMENEILKREQEVGIKKLNDRITKLTFQHHEQDKQIQNMIEKALLAKRRFGKQLRILEDSLKMKEQEKLKEISYKKGSLSHVIGDYANLLEFKKVLEAAPESLDKNIQCLERDFEQRVKLQEGEIETLYFKHEQEKTEINNKVKAVLQTFVFESNMGMNMATELRLTTAYSVNEKIKKEIHIHQKQQGELIERIKILKELNAELMKDNSRLVDNRREVLNLKNRKICLPEDDVVTAIETC